MKVANDMRRFKALVVGPSDTGEIGLSYQATNALSGLKGKGSGSQLMSIYKGYQDGVQKSTITTSLGNVRSLPDGTFCALLTTLTQAVGQDNSATGSGRNVVLNRQKMLLASYELGGSYQQIKYNADSVKAIQALAGASVEDVSGTDYVIGSIAADVLTGNAAGSSRAMFVGCGGDDAITTGGGPATVVFNALSGCSTISDFKSNTTKIALDKSVFSALGRKRYSGELSGATLPMRMPLAFDSETHTLFYKSSAKGSQPFAVAILPGVSTLSWSDIQAF